MTAPHDPRSGEATWWEDEGRRIAGQLREVSAALIVGPNAEQAAHVALGIARAESEHRHVALGDLVGDLAPLYAVAGGEDAFGLSDCLREGLPLNDIARPAPDRGSLFILPAGSPPVACEEVLGHERWPKLVNGFASAGALLLLVVPPGAAGFDALAGATGGIVLVGAPAARARNFPILGMVAAPPAQRRTTPPAAKPQPRRKAMIVALVALVVLAALAWASRTRIRTALHANIRPPAPTDHSVAAPGIASAPEKGASLAVAPAPAPPADTVRLTDPVNPADTTSTSPFAVEVMAANTVAGANSYLSDHQKSAPLRGATVSPVIVGGSTSVWYKVTVGAWHEHADADSLLAVLRHDGLVRSGEGRVVKVPYALLIADKIDRSKAPDLHDLWVRRGFNPYLLVQDDGALRLLAGAFETAAQAAPLAAQLRAAGVAPVLAFRTGRTY